MRIIDEKGRIFGLVNLVDLLVLVAVLFIAFTAYGLVTKKGNISVVSDDKDITMSMLIPEVRPEQVKFIKKGDILKRQETQGIIGTIEEVEVKTASVLVDTRDGTKVLTDSPRDKDVYITVKTKGRAGADMIATGTEVVKVGVKFNFVTKWFFGTATVMDLEVQ